VPRCTLLSEVYLTLLFQLLVADAVHAPVGGLLSDEPLNGALAYINETSTADDESVVALNVEQLSTVHRSVSKEAQ